MTHIIMAAGEASGDRLGAELAQEIRRQRPAVSISGVGGEAMRAAGVTLIDSCTALSVMGYWDVLKNLPAILRVRRNLLAALKTARPALFIGIDAPDFNLGVALRAKAAGIKTVQYVSPSIWMWRANRLNKIRRAADAVWCLFPFELANYANSGIKAVFVGHPQALQKPDKAAARKALAATPQQQIVALMPGSRAAELRLHLPLFAQVAKQLRHCERRFIAIAADAAAAARMRAALPSVEVHVGDAASVLAAADVALVKSGTSTLQAALAGTPMVIVYKMSPPAYWLGGRRTFRLPFFGLPNILCGRFVVPELLQQDAQPQLICRQLLRLLENKKCAAAQRDAFADIGEQLAAGGGTKTAAAAALSML